MKNKKNLTPQDKLMKAIFGKLPEEMTDEEKARTEDRIYEEQANSVTDEEFEKLNGEKPDKFVGRMMLWAGWLESIMSWHREHGNDRKYHVMGDEKYIFTAKQVVDMVQMFYRQGVEDGKNGTTEYDRLWKINRKNYEQSAENDTKED